MSLYNSLPGLNSINTHMLQSGATKFLSTHMYHHIHVMTSCKHNQVVHMVCTDQSHKDECINSNPHGSIEGIKTALACLTMTHVCVDLTHCVAHSCMLNMHVQHAHKACTLI